MFYFLRHDKKHWWFRVTDTAIDDVLKWYQRKEISKENILSFPLLQTLEISLLNPYNYELSIGKQYYISIKQNSIAFVFKPNQYIAKWFRPVKQAISSETIKEIYQRIGVVTKVNKLNKTTVKDATQYNTAPYITQDDDATDNFLIELPNLDETNVIDEPNDYYTSTSYKKQIEYASEHIDNWEEEADEPETTEIVE